MLVATCSASDAFVRGDESNQNNLSPALRARTFRETVPRRMDRPLDLRPDAAACQCLDLYLKGPGGHRRPMSGSYRPRRSRRLSPAGIDRREEPCTKDKEREAEEMRTVVIDIVARLLGLTVRINGVAYGKPVDLKKYAEN
jgi:hypothetical protein